MAQFYWKRYEMMPPEAERDTLVEVHIKLQVPDDRYYTLYLTVDDVLQRAAFVFSAQTVDRYLTLCQTIYIPPTAPLGQILPVTAYILADKMPVHPVQAPRGTDEADKENAENVNEVKEKQVDKKQSGIKIKGPHNKGDS